MFCLNKKKTTLINNRNLISRKNAFNKKIEHKKGKVDF